MKAIKGGYAMTQRFFLSSKSPLPTGEFGRKGEIDHKNRLVFHTDLDFAGLWIVKVKRTDIPIHLNQPYVVEIMAEGGHFGPGADNQLRETDIKCLTILLDYIKQQSPHTFLMEFYSAWYGEENRNPAKRSAVSFKDLTEPVQLVIEDREYLEISHRAWQEKNNC
jgi:hypothetical protein